MRTLFVSVLLAVAFTAACSKEKEQAAEVKPSEAVPTITVEELAAQLGTVQVVDANGEATRKRIGVIPGAILLSDSEAFSLSELPADKSKPLVFYCANTYCGSSDEAAKRARMAGHKDVKVLPDGVAGWAKAGKQVTRI